MFRKLTIKKTSEWVLEAMKPKFEKFKAEAEERISKFERENDVKFPTDYRTFLAELETITSYIGLSIEEEGEEDCNIYAYTEYIDYPMYYTFHNAKGKAIFGVWDLNSIHPKIPGTLNATHFFDGEGRKQYFPICNNGCGDELIINLKEAEPKIYVWDHELSEGEKNKIKLIANSFTEFMAGLKKKE